MKTLVQKLQSRKLWAAVAGIVTGLAMVFGLDEGIMSTVSGAVVAVSSVITYIIAEGRIDAEAVKAAIEAAEKAREALEGEEDGTAAAAADGAPGSSRPTV
jgi:phage shock protein PspC (stress-responsive transcriptional regulator)